MKALHQLVAGYSRGDAISNEARVLAKIFRSWGYESRIFSEQKRILPELRGECSDIAELATILRPTDTVLLHLSIGSVVNDVFAGLRCRRALLYHNITPPEHLRWLKPEMANMLAKGRQQLAALAHSAEVVMADSAYNAAELESAGYRKVQVLPLVLDRKMVQNQPDRRLLGEYSDGLVNVVFVGRCVPNKKIEDLLTAFYYFQRGVCPNSRLIHAGSFAGMEKYHALLTAQIRELGLANVRLLGSVTQAQLSAVYESAHVFLSMSEHEGFCIPLLESMEHGVPVLAYAAGAVPETMGKAGVLFWEKRYPEIAEMLGLLAADQSFRQSIIYGQKVRMADFWSRAPEAELAPLRW